MINAVHRDMDDVSPVRRVCKLLCLLKQEALSNLLVSHCFPYGAPIGFYDFRSSVVPSLVHIHIAQSYGCYLVIRSLPDTLKQLGLFSCNFGGL